MSAVLKPPLAEQHDRSRFLGGSDIAAVIGLSPWATPVELWLQKTGRKPKEQPTREKQRMYERGHKLEPFIRDMVITKLEDMGCQVELLACNGRYPDREHPFLSCEIDFELRITGEVEIGGRLFTFDREEINADAKSVSGFARKKWGMDSNEDVPIEYAAQFMHGLGITGRRVCLVAALRSFDDVDIYWTVADDETIAAMRQKAVLFWNECVLADKAPDPYTFSDIKLLFPTDNGQAREATPEIAGKVAQLQQIKSRIKEWENAEEALTFEIGEFISPHASLTHEGRELCTFKAQGDTRIDVERMKEEAAGIYRQFCRTKTIRVLRLKKPKKEA